MNAKCPETCPLTACTPKSEICPASAETKLAIHRDNIRHQRSLIVLPLYSGSGRWDRSKQRRGIRRLDAVNR